jgi:hypothetical protein
MVILFKFPVATFAPKLGANPSGPTAGISRIFRRHSIAVVDQIRAMNRRRFISKVGVLNIADLTALESAARQVLQLGS